jgi:hypothetical protein
MPYFARSGELDLDDVFGDLLKQKNVTRMRDIHTKKPIPSAESWLRDFAEKDADVGSLLLV